MFGDSGSGFDFFDEPETAETLEPGWPRPRERVPASSGGGLDSWRPRSGLAGIVRLAVLVAVVIAAVVGLVTGVGACQGSARSEYSHYLEAVRALAQSSSRVGAELVSELQSPSSTAASLVTKLQADAVQEQGAYDQAQTLQPPGPLRRAHQELLAALELRATGLASLSRALATVTEQKSTGQAAADALTAQAQLLTTSDVIWSQLYQAPASEQIRERGLSRLTVPRSRFLPSPYLVGRSAFTQLLHHLRRTPTTRPSLPLLKLGTAGAAVTAWQKQLNHWLRTQPGQTPLPTNGTFDTRTETATKALQQLAGITADGIVGPATRQALTRAVAPRK